MTRQGIERHVILDSGTKSQKEIGWIKHDVEEGKERSFTRNGSVVLGKSEDEMRTANSFDSFRPRHIAC